MRWWLVVAAALPAAAFDVPSPSSILNVSVRRGLRNDVTCPETPTAYTAAHLDTPALNTVYSIDVDEVSGGVATYWSPDRRTVLWRCARSGLTHAVLTSAAEFNRTRDPGLCQDVADVIALRIDSRDVVSAGLLVEWRALSPTVPVIGRTVGVWVPSNATFTCAETHLTVWKGAAATACVAVALVLAAVAVAATGAGSGMMLPGSAPWVFPPVPGRAFTRDLYNEVEPKEEEMRALPADIHRLPLKVLCWRRSTLALSTLLHCVAAAGVAADLYCSGHFDFKVQTSAIFPPSVVEGWAVHFQALTFLPVAQVCVGIAASFLACARWRSYGRSSALAVGGWLTAFFLPFGFYFVPWFTFNSPQETTQYVCASLMHWLDRELSAYRYTYVDDASFIPGHARPDARLVDIAAVCALPPDEIEGELNSIEMTLRDDGLTSGVPTIVAAAVAHMSTYVMYFLGLTVKYGAYIPFLVAAVQVLIKLFPGTLSLLLGMIKGAKVVKVLLPESVFTGWLLVLSQFAALPIVMLFLALVTVCIGTYPATIAAVLLILSQLTISLRPAEILHAYGRKEASDAIACATNGSYALMAAGVCCLFAGVLLAPHLLALKEDAKAYLSNGSQYVSLGSTLLQTLAGSVLSTCAFMDASLTVVQKTHTAAAAQDADVRERLSAGIDALSTAVPRFWPLRVQQGSSVEGGSQERRDSRGLPMLMGSFTADGPPQEMDSI